MPRLSFYPVADSYLLVAVAALVLLVLLLLGPGRGKVGVEKRAALLALRLGIIALIVLALLRPTIVYTRTKRQSATLVVLLDATLSMTVPDAVAGQTRWQALRRALADAEKALRALSEDFELKVYTFDARPHPLEVEDGKIILAESPQGDQSAIGSSLKEVLRLETEKRLLGVILLSDGAQRTLAASAVAPQTAAMEMKTDGYKLFTVPLGQSRGLGQSQDVAVRELLVNQSVFVKNELSVAGQIRVDGYVNREIPVQLLFEIAPGKMEVVATEKIRSSSDGQLLPVRFRYAPQVAGEFKLALEVVAQPGERVETNNRRSTFVNVLKGGLNVLYLEGFPPRPEQKYLAWALGASPDINVDVFGIDPRRAETRPADLAERLQPGKYEVYILGDLDAGAFRGGESRDGELANLAKAVDRGAGLIMLGGFHSFGPGGYATTPLADVLPVEMNRFERQNFGEAIRTELHLPGPLKMRPTRLGLLHFALMLSGSRQESEALWAKLPPLDGANRFRKLAPAAVTLADAGSNRPLLVAHSFGNGRALAFAGDSTWRWWMHGHELVHKRFWRQVILWLARKDQLMEGNVWIRLQNRRVNPAGRVEFTAGARSATGEPVTDATFQARVVLPDESARSITLVREGETMAGSFRDTQLPGDYAVEVTATHEGAVLGKARARFLVARQNLELDNAAADVTTMESLAAMTGGESIPPEKLSELIGRLAQQTESLEVQQSSKETFWDSWPFFLFLVLLLGVEWYLRKRWGLV